MIIPFICALTIGQFTPHQLHKQIDWKLQQEISKNVTIKSYTPMSQEKIEFLRNEIKNAQNIFRVNYKINCKPGPLEIRMLKLGWMNSSDYFEWTENNYITYGRYYRLNNIMYVTTDIFNEPYIFRHEMLHYLFDECGITFGSEQLEHRNIDKLLNR